MSQSHFSGTPLTPIHQGSAPTSYIRGNDNRNRDVKMEESEDSVADEDEYDARARARARSDEDDEGVFGRMEE